MTETKTQRPSQDNYWGEKIEKFFFKLGFTLSNKSWSYQKKENKNEKRIRKLVRRNAKINTFFVSATLGVETFVYLCLSVINDIFHIFILLTL